jgi:hypothetical protein
MPSQTCFLGKCIIRVHGLKIMKVKKNIFTLLEEYVAKFPGVGKLLSKL